MSRRFRLKRVGRLRFVCKPLRNIDSRHVDEGEGDTTKDMSEYSTRSKAFKYQRIPFDRAANSESSGLNWLETRDSTGNPFLLDARINSAAD
jgi:hypothetical protein